MVLFKKKQPIASIAPPTKLVDVITLEEERVYRKGISTVRDLIAPAAMELKPDYLKLGDVYVRTLFILTYPRYIAIGWFSPIINLNQTLDIAMFFYPIKTELILKQLRNKVGNLEAQIVGDADKGMPRDPMAETALRDIEVLRDNLTQGTEKFFQYALYITTYAQTT